MIIITSTIDLECRFIENFKLFVVHYNRMINELVNHCFNQSLNSTLKICMKENGHSTDFAEHWVTQENESTKNLG